VTLKCKEYLKNRGRKSGQAMAGPPTMALCIGYNHISRGIESHSFSWRMIYDFWVRVSEDGNTVGLTSVLDRGQFVF